MNQPSWECYSSSSCYPHSSYTHSRLPRPRRRRILRSPRRFYRWRDSGQLNHGAGGSWILLRFLLLDSWFAWSSRGRNLWWRRWKKRRRLCCFCFPWGFLNAWSSEGDSRRMSPSTSETQAVDLRFLSIIIRYEWSILVFKITTISLLTLVWFCPICWWWLVSQAIIRSCWFVVSVMLYMEKLWFSS